MSSNCRSCHAPIDWVDGPEGKRTPVDVDTGESHFKTCPDAKQWSRQKPAGATSAAPNPARDRAIARMSALRSAAIYCGHRSAVDEKVKSSDVLRIAESWLKWLEEPG